MTYLLGNYTRFKPICQGLIGISSGNPDRLEKANLFRLILRIKLTGARLPLRVFRPVNFLTQNPPFIHCFLSSPTLMVPYEETPLRFV